MPILECPSCQIEVQPSDRFCESCGTALPAVHIAPSCSKCNAQAIDAEGFCGQCGFRSGFRVEGHTEPSDRVELNLSPILAGVSDRGLVHTRNEDAIALASIDAAQILVVCDGVSSSLNPQLASQTAAQAIAEALSEGVRSQLDPARALQAAIAQAQIAVSALQTAPHFAENPPSTTVVTAIVQADTATIGWLGDSRAYWVPAIAAELQTIDRAAQQLTEDDSWLQAAVKAGRSIAAAQKDAQAHAITRWLGADAADVQPTVVTVQLHRPGYLILCSDGLWNYLRDAADLSRLIAVCAADDAAKIADCLVEYARSQGGFDNISVAVLVV